MCDGSQSLCNVQLTGTYLSIDSYMSWSTVNPEEKGKTHSTPHPNINVEMNFDFRKWRQHWNGERGLRLSFFHGGGRAVPLKLRWEILCFLNVVAKLWKSFRMLESSWVVKVVITFATARRYVGGNVETVETIFQRSGNYCNLHGNRGIVKIK